MALYRFEATIVSRNPPRGKPRNVIQDAAYIGRQALTDDRTGEKFDYSSLGGLEWQGIFAPKGAPKWVQDRDTLWNAVEEREDESRKSDNAQLARKFIIALPHELNQLERKRLITDFARELSRKGMIVDVAIHTPDKHSDDRNYHAHLLVTMREITPTGFGNKVREWNAPEQLRRWRERYAELGARALARAGNNLESERYRVGHKTIKERHKEAVRRGDTSHARTLKDRIPTIHLGPNVMGMERDRKIKTRKGDILRAIQKRNEERGVPPSAIPATLLHDHSAHLISRDA